MEVFELRRCEVAAATRGRSTALVRRHPLLELRHLALLALNEPVDTGSTTNEESNGKAEYETTDARSDNDANGNGVLGLFAGARDNNDCSVALGNGGVTIQTAPQLTALANAGEAIAVAVLTAVVRAPGQGAVDAKVSRGALADALQVTEASEGAAVRAEAQAGRGFGDVGARGRNDQRERDLVGVVHQTLGLHGDGVLVADGLEGDLLHRVH
mmetsp:Transcript_20473/g.57684  ORF Transcript_20473/g.57684 Transcript_20473/m.57684 type:complete len:213 (+) Transcript_20473:34-672(+)